MHLKHEARIQKSGPLNCSGSCLLQQLQGKWPVKSNVNEQAGELHQTQVAALTLECTTRLLTKFIRVH